VSVQARACGKQMLKARWLDCATPISFLAQKLQCFAPESARALANVRDLQPARERKSTGALDLFRDT
jgi:hypothetical protein